MKKTVQGMSGDLEGYFFSAEDERPLRWGQIVINECVPLVEQVTSRFNGHKREMVNTFLKQLSDSKLHFLFLLFGDFYMGWLRPNKRNNKPWTKTSSNDIQRYISNVLQNTLSEVEQMIKLIVNEIKFKKKISTSSEHTTTKIKNALEKVFAQEKLGDLHTVIKDEISYTNITDGSDPTQYFKKEIQNQLLSPQPWTCIHMMESEFIEKAVYLLCVRYINTRRSIQTTKSDDFEIDQSIIQLNTGYFTIFQHISEYTYSMRTLGMNIDLMSTLDEMSADGRDYNHNFSKLVARAERIVHDIFNANHDMKESKGSISDIKVQYVTHYYHDARYDSGNVIKLKLFSPEKKQSIFLTMSYQLYDVGGNQLYIYIEYAHEADPTTKQQYEFIDLSDDTIQELLSYIHEDILISDITNDALDDSDSD